MDYKTYGYLYYTVRNYGKEDIMKEAELSDDEFEALELELQPLLAEISAERDKAEHCGEEFVRLTNYIYGRLNDIYAGLPCPPAVNPRGGEETMLPKIDPNHISDLSVPRAINQRRSLREYSEEKLSQDDLSFLLWSSSWARELKTAGNKEFTRRNVPSAGSRHPFECFLMINRVEGIAPGLYYYHPVRHSLTLQNSSPEASSQIWDCCHRQKMVKGAAVVFLLSAVAYRSTWHFGQRGYRCMFLDAGHWAQNLYLASEAIGAGACAITSFWDEGLQKVLGLNGENEFVIYLLSVGRKKPPAD